VCVSASFYASLYRHSSLSINLFTHTHTHNTHTHTYTSRSYGGGINFFDENNTEAKSSTPAPVETDMLALWACMDCTVENEPGAPECVVCHAMNPVTMIALAEANNMGGSGGVGVPVAWSCALCTFENTGTSVCIICQTPKIISDETGNIAQSTTPISTTTIAPLEVKVTSSSSLSSSSTADPLGSVDADAQADILTSIQGKMDFIWAKNKVVIGAQGVYLCMCVNIYMCVCGARP
jgi:hypothetical protein